LRKLGFDFFHSGFDLLHKTFDLLEEAACAALGGDVEFDEIAVAHESPGFGDDLFAIVWRRGRKVLKKHTIDKIGTVEAANLLKQIIDRGYINPQEGTLDYAILFVPNEDLFSFISIR
jgi:hypothetical protein